jgi:transcriptional regulator with GAF, ATPase, and Fis domain
LQAENASLREEVVELQGHDRIIGRSPAIRRAFNDARQVAATSSTVLLLGETGTGKERFANAIHRMSARRHRVMVRVSCAAIPASLIESELFGRERGAYTGALARQIGRFERANGSTIFLDEIGDLPPEVQVKLLRVLQEREVERLGGSRPIPVDVRVIAATNHDLGREILEGRIREDLFYRLNVFPITIPPLRERPEDIALLVQAVVQELAGVVGRRIDSIDQASLDALVPYAWPGNVRELRNVVERALMTSAGPVLRIPVPREPGAKGAAGPASPPATAVTYLKAVEREHILRVLHAVGWRIRGAGGAAERLGLKPTTLEYRMARLDIRRPGGRRGSGTPL